MSNYDLGTAEGQIRIRYDGRGVNEAGDGLDTFTSKAKKAQGQFQDVARTTGLAAGLLAAGIGLAVNSAIDFEKRVSAIGAVSGASADQMEALRSKALQLGADTAFSATESALAMEELVKAGLSVTDVLNGAADATVALAAAGEVDLPTAAAIASNAMNAFGLAAEEMPRVADLIAGAANASAIDVNEFGLSLSQAGAVANLVGLSFDDLTTAIALMGNQGIKGSDAGTSLKTMLQNLQPTTQKQIDLFKELGLVTADGTNQFFDQEGHIKSLADVAGVLQKALGDATDQEKALKLEMLFGSDAIRAAAILADAGADGFNNLAGAIGEVSAKDVAAARLDNVAGAIEQLKGSAETAAIAFGSALLPTIRKITEFITKLINVFTNLDPRWQKLIAFAAVAVTGLLALAAAVATLGAIAAGIGAAVTAGLLPIIGIVAAVVAGIALLVGGFILLWKKSETFRDAVKAIGSSVKTIFNRMSEAVKPLVKWFRDELVPAVKAGAKQFVEKLKPAFDSVVKLIQDKVVPFFDKIGDAIERIMPTLIEIANFLKSVFLTTWQAVGTVLGFLIPIIVAVAGFLIDLLGSAISFLIDLIPILWGFLKGLVGAVVGFGKAIAEAAVAVWDFFANLPERIGAFLGSIATWLVEHGKQLITGLWNGIKNAYESVKTWFEELPGRVLGLLVTIGTWLLQKGKDLVNGLLNGIKEKYEAVKTWVTELPGKVKDTLGDLSTKLKESGKALIQGFWDGIKSKWNDMKSWVTDALGGLRNLWPFSPAKEGPFAGRGWVLYSGRALMEGFAQGIIDRTGDAVIAAKQALASVSSAMPTDYSATVSAATTGTAATGSTVSGFAQPTTTNNNTTSHTTVNVNVPLEDLRSVKDVQDLLDFVDRLRNNERRELVGA